MSARYFYVPILMLLTLAACLPNSFGPVAPPLLRQPPFEATPERVDARLKRYVGVRCEICSSQATTSLNGLATTLSLRYFENRLFRLYFSGDALMLPAQRGALEQQLASLEGLLRGVYGEPLDNLTLEIESIAPGDIKTVLHWPVQENVRARLGVGRYEFDYYPVVVLEHAPLVEAYERLLAAP